MRKRKPLFLMVLAGEVVSAHFELLLNSPRLQGAVFSRLPQPAKGGVLVSCGCRGRRASERVVLYICLAQGEFPSGMFSGTLGTLLLPQDSTFRSWATHGAGCRLDWQLEPSLQPMPMPGELQAKLRRLVQTTVTQAMSCTQLQLTMHCKLAPALCL